MTNTRENELLKIPAYRHLLEEKIKLVKRLNFAEQRLAKYSFALSDEDVQTLQQRIAATMLQLADINDKLTDMEENPVTGTQPKHWVGNASKALQEASWRAYCGQRR